MCVVAPADPISWRGWSTTPAPSRTRFCEMWPRYIAEMRTRDERGSWPESIIRGICLARDLSMRIRRDIRRGDCLEVELCRAEVVGLAAVCASSEHEGHICLALVARSERGGDGAELTYVDDVGHDADVEMRCRDEIGGWDGMGWDGMGWDGMRWDDRRGRAARRRCARSQSR